VVSRVIRRFLAVAALIAVFTASLSAPASVLADAPIPPLRPDGPVVLPDGRVLPVKPASSQEASVQAEMLAAHGSDQIQFTPGDRPQPIGAPDATLSLFTGSASRITPLGLAAASGPTATLTADGLLPNGLRKEVLGFLPYWMLDADSLQWMQYQLVTTIAYFGVAAYSDGTLATTSVGWSGWNSSSMTGVINSAHARGVRVVLTVTMMAWDGGAAQAALLGNATARANLVNAIVAAVASRAADGVNLDFEPVSTTLRDQYTSFVRQLKAGLAAAGVGSYLTVCTMGGAAVWASGYDLAGLTAAGAAEAVFVMGYDFSWSGSSRAGGVAPMESAYVLDVQDSIDSYLSIIPGSKIIFGVPYYGRTWLTTSDALNATTVPGASGSSKAYYYTGSRDLAATYGRRWDDVGKVPWFAYYDSAKGSWVEGYYDDAASLGEKYDMINARGLAGTGMWTLLMDQGDNALWNLLAAKFVTDMTPASYVPLAPARVLDSRFGNGLSGKFSAGVPRTFQVSGRGGVPANATAVTGNLTVTNQTVAGAAFLGPSPISAPSSSTLNFPVGDNRANGVTLALGAGGTLSATYLASSGSTDFVFDVTGYFVP
jgi:spore germination protein YaaH